MVAVAVLVLVCKAAVASDITWVIDAKPEGDHSCTNVCKDMGGTCEQSEIDKLKTEADVKAAFKKTLEAYDCKRFNKGCEAQGRSECVNWGSPFIHGSHYGGTDGSGVKGGECFYGECLALRCVAWCVVCAVRWGCSLGRLARGLRVVWGVCMFGA